MNPLVVHGSSLLPRTPGWWLGVPAEVQGVRPTPGCMSCLQISETVNDKLVVPIVLIKRDLILGLKHGFIFSVEEQQTSSCASSRVSVISLTNHWVQV